MGLVKAWNLQILFYSVLRDVRRRSVLARAGLDTIRAWRRPESGITRRGLLVSALAAAGLRAEGRKGELFPTEAARYPDPLTEIEVYRLTRPDYATTLTAYYNRGIARNSGWMLCTCDRTGTPQGFRLELKSGEMRQVTDIEGLDAASLTLTPDNRSFCYLAGRSLYTSPRVHV